MALTTSELVWLKSLLASSGVFSATPMRLYCDSNVALHIAKNPVFHEQMKHIEIDCHFMWERLESGDLTVSYLPSQHQPIGIFSKALGQQQLVYLRGKLGMIDTHICSTLKGSITRLCEIIFLDDIFWL